jgi:beta-mannosidase
MAMAIISPLFLPSIYVFKTKNYSLLTMLMMIKILVLIFTSSFLFAQTEDKKLWQPYRISPRTGNQHIDLSGTWELSFMDKPVGDVRELENRKDPFQTQVPNSIHWSLHKAGKLPHPYANKNSTQYRWAEEKAWYYKKTFTVPASAKGNHLFLCFDGVDYFSKVWINATLVGVHEGIFGGPVIDATDLVKYGENNELIVEVRAGNWGNRATDFETLPFNEKGERDISKSTGYKSRASGKIIKPWIISGGSGTEAFFSVGMWQGVRLEIVPSYHLERPFITTQSVSSTEAKLHISTEVFVNKNSLQLQLHPWVNTQIHHPDEKGVAYVPLNEQLSVSVEFASKGKTVFKKNIPLNLYMGRNWLEEDIIIPDPMLWNPNGLGDPNLYVVNLTLNKDNQPIDKISFNYGIRTIERVPTAGPRNFDRWENWQFIINGKKIFVKGMNWTPADVLLDLPEERYRWALHAAKDMGVQLIRVWGGGLLETDHFYNICNELGIMIWQDFPIGNQDTPHYPQDVWEAQVVQNIFRLRNHPSLVMWCGGNEFNPYSNGNAASVGIIERNLDIFDNIRFFVRTTPDDGSIHVYPDMDPTWYNKSYKLEAWMSETGMHSMPEPSLFHELVDKKEFFDLGKMWDPKFPATHPELIHHFTEYSAARVPRMVSRASHIDNMANPTIESISEASQVGAGEWYQIVSEKMQGNYPVTAGLMPWVFKRHWPVIAIQMMDWFGQAVAPYYFLKRTYEPTHIAVDIPRMLWKSGETMEVKTSITHAPSISLSNAKLVITAFDDQFKQVWKEEKQMTIPEGTSVIKTDVGRYTIPQDYKDRYLFILAELQDATGNMISQSYYYPRVLSLMDDETFYTKYVNEPIAWVTLDKGPWLKPSVAKTPTALDVKLISNSGASENSTTLRVRVKNTGKIPAFMTKLDIEGTKRAFYASDNYFWLKPGDEREITITVQWRELNTKKNAKISVSAWNALKKSVSAK